MSGKGCNRKDFFWSALIKMNPDSAKAYNNRGIIYYTKGDYEQALADYTQAVKLKPDYADALRNREQVLQKKQESVAK